MKKLILLFTGVAFAASMLAGTPALTLHKTTKVCIPDGVGNIGSTEPWVSTWIPMLAKKTANTVDEMSANFQLAYNDTYLWILAKQTGNATTDTGVVAIPNSWERDDFETFVAMDTTAYAYAGKYGEANFQFRQQRSADNNFPWAFDDHNSAAANSKDFKVGQVDAGDGSFVQEWQIPWASLTAVMVDSGKFDGSNILFEIQAADNTTGAAGGRNDQTFWKNNSDNEYQDSRTLSWVMLAEKVVMGVNVNTPTLNSISINTVATDVLKISKTVKSAELFNISGQLVLRANNVNTINVSGLAAGIYLFRANQQVIKFVKK